MKLRILFLLILVSSIQAIDHYGPTSAAELYHEFIRSFLGLISKEVDLDKFEHMKEDYKLKRRSDPNTRALSMDELPYFKVLPKFRGSLPPGSQMQITDSCFELITITSEESESGGIYIIISTENPSDILCHTSFIINSDTKLEVEEIWFGSKQVEFPAPTSEAETWDLLERGPRVFQYGISPEIVTYNLAATAVLFEPVLQQGVPDLVANLNREFLKAYAGIDMEPRTEAPEVLEIPAEWIKNGDTFNIMRLDGLNPMIGWAMGSATGHTAIALWREDQLFLCESNTKDAYWPVNGIQCNKYLDWLEYGRLNDYEVVWVPLDEQTYSGLNWTKAWELIDSRLGIDYGWEMVLSGVFDTLAANMPCANENKTHCIEMEHFEMLFTYMERHSQVAARVYKPAIMQRSGVDFDRPLVDAYYQAWQDGISPEELLIIPEKDGWVYPTNRNGEPEMSPVAICNVFVCSVWKASGLFGDLTDTINCGETTCNDNYKLKIYKDPELRPDICKEVDPENPNCQLLGKFTLRLDSQPGVLPRYNYVTPSAHMFESCPGQFPDYLADPTC